MQGGMCDGGGARNIFSQPHSWRKPQQRNFAVFAVHCETLSACELNFGDVYLIICTALLQCRSLSCSRVRVDRAHEYTVCDPLLLFLYSD